MSLSRILNDAPVPHPRPDFPADDSLLLSLPPPPPERLLLQSKLPSASSLPTELSVVRAMLPESSRVSLEPDTIQPPPLAPEPQRRQGDEEATPRKRRKGAHINPELNAPGSRRSTLRKQPSKTKHMSMHIPVHAAVNDPPPNPPTHDPNRTLLTEEQRRLASSDLEDCEEIWIGELTEYMLETQRRKKQLAEWYESTVIDQNAVTAQDMYHHYSNRIARIPAPPPIPPPHAYNEDYEDASQLLDYGFQVGHVEGRRRSRYDAEDAANELERSILGDYNDVPTPRLGKKMATGKEPLKRPPSDAGSDFDVPRDYKATGPASKRRKVENDDPHPHRHERVDVYPVSASVSKTKGKAKQRDDTPDSLSAPIKHSKRKMARKKFGPELELELLSHPPSAAGDATPAVSISQPPSPAPTGSGFIFELDDEIPPLRKAKKVDELTMVKRVKTLEEAQKKVWTNIARRDIAKVYKYQLLGYQARQSQTERIAKVASLQARRPFTKTAKATKDIQAKAKRLMREMQVFWKKNEKEERDIRKREQKEASDRLKVEEEKREAARQARKLEFLISQTELYSHFVGSKLKTAEIEGDGEGLLAPAGLKVGEVHSDANLGDINFDDDDDTNLHRHARRNAEEAIALARERAQQFDTQAALERKTNEALQLARAQAHIHDTEETTQDAEGQTSNLDFDDLNFQNPTSLNGQPTIAQPKMLMAQLKEYQLKGLNWLATLYEQGINGILADEMGLGKTVQSISLLAYLAETHDIWGPFLVVAPASTLHNWQQEITRFVPALKALPYWGNVKDRATLRKFWSKKEISYNKDAPFHVLITSYQLVTQDQQYFQRVKWQYMILDEAQNIKNSASVRWKTLLGFHCRNRLLLTGTPIQNSMQELWALLHFIMPSLFDSHDEFNEWFSKDIENAAENKGSKLNEHQLRRLHMILKPFMLRRVKRHVQNELSEKIEKDIFVDLSARQRSLYNILLSHVSVADLLAKAANLNDADSARSLMNLVMQFRKVCNHPELFERADVVAPFSFSTFGRSGPRDGDWILLPYSTRNPIEFSVPRLLHLDGCLLDKPGDNPLRPQKSCLIKMFNIWSTDWIHRSLREKAASSFSFLQICNTSPGEAHSLHIAPLIRRQLSAISKDKDEIAFSLDPDFVAHAARGALELTISSPCVLSDAPNGFPCLHQISQSAWSQSCLSRLDLRWYIPPVVAPPIAMYCADPTFLQSQAQLLDGPLESLALYGIPPHIRDSEVALELYSKKIPNLPPSGLLTSSSQDQLPMSTMQVPEAKRLIYDSAKLARLDSLLQELKQGDHRVLIYFQMTRMMDLMEEYLIYRQYRYLRLDGSSKLEDRRDMVIDWQTRPDIFVFLLSTRAGGLGINLTAADTVVFYDHDWNPSNDAQAMDRAHRLGQTRQVTVYRLITKGTIDERIVQLARVKKDVQDIVVGNKNLTDVTKPSEIVQLLLNDEQLATLKTSKASDISLNKRADGITNSAASQDLWDEEEDNFFGHPAAAASNPEGEETNVVKPASTRGKRRKPGAAGASRGRRIPGKKKHGNALDAPAT